MKGKYFIDEIDGVLYSTDNYALYNLHHSMFYGEIRSEKEKHDMRKIDMSVVTFNGKIFHKFK